MKTRILILLSVFLAAASTVWLLADKETVEPTPEQSAPVPTPVTDDGSSVAVPEPAPAETASETAEPAPADAAEAAPAEAEGESAPAETAEPATEAPSKTAEVPPAETDQTSAPAEVAAITEPTVGNVIPGQGDQAVSATNLLAAVEVTTGAAVVIPETDAATTNTATAVDGNNEPGLINIPEAPLTDVISTLARQAGINFQFDPRVTANVGPDGKPLPQATVSIRWENVTAQQALEALLNNHGLVLLQDQKTKIGRITIKDPAAPDPLFTRVIQLRYASPTNIAAVIQPVLSARSKVLTDGRTSKLVLVATEKELEEVDSLLTELDIAPRQVLIEARLLETSKNPQSVKGIDWAGTLEAQNVTFGNGNTTGTTVTRIPGDSGTTTTTLPSGRQVTSTSSSGSSAQTLLTTAVGGAGLGLNTAKGYYPATAFLNADGVSAVLSFLNKDSDTEVVATPRTVTLDNQMAKLEVTRAFPIFKTTPGTSQTPAGSEITYTNLGTILNVTPRISANSNISLRVIPEVSNIDSKDRQISNGQINEANVYAVRRIETQVVIPNGNTLVMGGLISDSSGKAYTKVPILGDLPGIGLAFRKESKTRNKQNLLIFITPTIVEDTDFQPTRSTFLKTQPVDKPDSPESAWDSGKPYDWTKRNQ